MIVAVLRDHSIGNVIIATQLYRNGQKLPPVIRPFTIPWKKPLEKPPKERSPLKI